MSSTVFYKKKGRRYIPISEYDSDFYNAIPYGTHITVCQKGHTIRRYDIDPSYGPLIAAGIIAEDSMVSALIKSGEMRPEITPLTLEQKEAWENLKNLLGKSSFYVYYPSAADIIRAGVQAMINETEKTLEHPAVKKAWDRFLIICELVKNEKS